MHKGQLHTMDSPDFSEQTIFSVWQEGYAAFSVSRSEENSVVEYIRNQDEHHRQQDFRAELLDLLNHHAVEFDPRYVFD